MATVETTTLRVPVQLRDEIARLAEARGTTMLDVVTTAIGRLTTDEWWDSVHHALDVMSVDDVDAYQTESTLLSNAVSDNLRAN